MPTKGVTDRQRVAKSLVTAAQVHSREVAENLRRKLSIALESDESLPDLEAFQLLLARYLEIRTEAIIAAEELHFVEEDGHLSPRRRRDEAAAELHATLVRIRDTLHAAFGREHFRELAGIREGTAVEPVWLLRQARRVLERLRQPPPDLPTRPLDGMQVELGRLAEQLQPALDGLARATREVDLEQRRSESTLREKDLALDAFDEAVAGVGRILIGCDILAGLREFADRVRLTLPARRRRGNTAPDDTGAEGTPPSEEEPLPGTPAAEVPETPEAPAEPEDPAVPEIPPPSVD